MLLYTSVLELQYITYNFFNFQFFLSNFLTVFDGKADTISRRSSMKCHITWTLECCLFNCWSQTGHFSPITTLFGFNASSCRLLSTNCLSARSSSSREWTNAICRATFCGFSPLIENKNNMHIWINCYLFEIYNLLQWQYISSCYTYNCILDKPLGLETQKLLPLALWWSGELYAPFHD